MKIAAISAFCAVLIAGSSAFAQCSQRQCGVQVLAPGVSVQVGSSFALPQVIVPQLVVPQFQLQTPTFQLPAQQTVQLPAFLSFAPERDSRVQIESRSGRLQVDSDRVRLIRRGIFGRVRRIEFYE